MEKYGFSTELPKTQRKEGYAKSYLCRVSLDAQDEQVVEFPESFEIQEIPPKQSPDWYEKLHERLRQRNYWLCSVSPDCKKALVMAQTAGVDELFFVRMDTRQVERVPNETGPNAFDCWSPDSNEFGFTDCRGLVICSAGDLTKQRVIFSMPGPKNWPRGWARSWSPDGKWIVFDLPITRPGFCLVSPDGASLTKLFRPFTKQDSGGYSIFECTGIQDPRWSKDGRYLAGVAFGSRFAYTNRLIGKDKSIGSITNKYIFVADLHEGKMAFYGSTEGCKVCLIEDSETIRKIKDRGRKWNDFAAIKRLEEDEIRFREKSTSLSSMWFWIAGAAHEVESYSPSVRYLMSRWLQVNSEAFKAHWQQCLEMTKKTGSEVGTGVRNYLDDGIEPRPVLCEFDAQVGTESNDRYAGMELQDTKEEWNGEVAIDRLFLKEFHKQDWRFHVYLRMLRVANDGESYSVDFRRTVCEWLREKAADFEGTIAFFKKLPSHQEYYAPIHILRVLELPRIPEEVK
jgi:hypothetical protein